MYLTLNHVTKTFPSRGGAGEVNAVHDVNIEIQKGELVTLLGPSGCGKTTTLRLVAGFEFPTSGDIILDGKVINNVPTHKRDMSMVFQSYAIFPHLNVYENIAYGLHVQKVGKAEIKTRIERVLDMVHLEGYETRAPNQLSGGQQQRVALARALVMNPKVLLMDEPLSNLDTKLREKMRFEIRQLQRELGFTSLYVTHDQLEAMTLADRIDILFDLFYRGCDCSVIDHNIAATGAMKLRGLRYCRPVLAKTSDTRRIHIALRRNFTAMNDDVPCRRRIHVCPYSRIKAPMLCIMIIGSKPGCHKHTCPFALSVDVERAIDYSIHSIIGKRRPIGEDDVGSTVAVDADWGISIHIITTDDIPLACGEFQFVIAIHNRRGTGGLLLSVSVNVSDGLCGLRPRRSAGQDERERHGRPHEVVFE